MRVMETYLAFTFIGWGLSAIGAFILFVLVPKKQFKKKQSKMKLSLRLNDVQLKELAKVFLNSGQAIFIGSVAAYFLPPLAEKTVSLRVLVGGVLASLTFIIIGVILLKEVKK